MENKTIVFFDGHCNLCNGTVQFLIKQDKAETLYFSSLQSSFAQSLIPAKIQLTKDSIVLLDKETFYIEADAVFQIIRKLNNWTRVFLVFRILPSKLATTLYQCIARNRYKFFGKRKECMIPDAKVANRFLS